MQNPLMYVFFGIGIFFCVNNRLCQQTNALAVFSETASAVLIVVPFSLLLYDFNCNDFSLQLKSIGTFSLPFSSSLYLISFLRRNILHSHHRNTNHSLYCVFTRCSGSHVLASSLAPQKYRPSVFARCSGFLAPHSHQPKQRSSSRSSTFFITY